MAIYLNTNTNEYPRFIGDIQIEFPSWNFGDELPSNWVEVEEVENPAYSDNEILEELQPKLVNGKYKQQWVVRKMTAEESERYNAPKTAKTKLMQLGLTENEIRAIMRGLLF